MKTPLSKGKLFKIIFVTFFIVFFLGGNTLNAKNIKGINTGTGLTQSGSSIKFKSLKLEPEVQSFQMFATTTQSLVPTNGIIGEWDLNGNINDSSGYDNHGTATNITWGNSSGNNQIANFNGINSSVEISDNSLYTVDDFTISVWGYLNATGNTRYVYQYDPISKDGIYLASDASDFYGVVFIGGSALILTGDITPITGKWDHLTLRRTNGLVEMYIDGVKQNQTGIKNGIIDSSDGWNIGQDYVGSARLNGKIGLIKYYDKSLSLSEIDNLYQEGQEKILGITSGPNTTTSSNGSNDINYEVLSNSTASYDTTDTACHTNASNKKVFTVNTVISVQETDAKNAGDPVTLSKGELTYDNTLMSIPGLKIPYELKLSYRNQTDYNGPAGINWDHNYNLFLQEEDNDNVLFYNGKLGIFRFIKNGSVFEYNPGLRATLQNNAGVYSIVYDNGDIHTFNATNNKIEKLEDIYGNNLTFSYTNDLISKVTDTLGRDIDYTYYSHNRIQDVTDFNGRKVSFNYFDGTTSSGSIYDLSTVTINNGVDALKTIKFEYDSENNITKLIDSKDQIYVENTYDSDDRVLTQLFGNGTIVYSYEGTGNAITKNTVIDKLGYKTEYIYDSNHYNISKKYYNLDQTDHVEYTYIYDTNGYVTKESRPNGNGYTYIYDTKGNLLSKRFKADVNVIDGVDDLVTSYTYNSLNKVLTQTNPNGLIETNTFDINGNITNKIISGVTTHTGSNYDITTSYSYGIDGLIDTITDGEGNITDFNYGSGQVIEIVKGSDTETYTGSFVYNDYGNILSSTDGEGFTTILELNDFNLIGTGTTAQGIVNSYEYDANNNKTKQTNYLSGGLEVNSYFYYDILDNMTGSLVDTGSGSQLLTSYKYDNNDQVIEIQVGNGAVTKYEYNEFGKVIQEKIIMDSGDTSKDIITQYSYDDNNNLVSKIDPEGNITTYEYDLYDRLIKEINPQGTYVLFEYNKDGTITSKQVFDSLNVILSRTNYSYDNLGKVVNEVSFSDPVNSLGAISNKVEYDKNGKVIKSIDAKGNISKNIYDSHGRLLISEDALGNIVTSIYDNRNLVTSSSVTPNNGTGTITTTSLYDNDARLVSQTNNLGNTKSIVYNELNQVISSTDEENNITDFDLDYLGNISQVTKYSSGTTISTSYKYDERSNLISVFDGNDNETKYEYDLINRNTKVIYADLKELLYTYDNNSNLLTQTDPNGTVVTNIYNTLNQLETRNITTGSGVTGVISESYTYDNLGRLISSIDSELGELDFEYDSLGRLIKETQNSGTGISYEYDLNHNLSKIIHPDLRETTYSYDELNRNTTVLFSGETVATYTHTGVLNTGITYGNGKAISFDYDNLLRLSTLDNGVKIYNYDYDKVNNIITDSIKNYNYDDLYRVSGVTHTASGTTLESFDYDNAGNRNSDLNNQYTTNSLNQYTTLSGSLNITYSYDNNGNITNNGEYTFEYDYKNRLLRVNSGTTIISEYIYDVLGRRIEKKVGNETITYIYSNKNILEEVRNNGIRDFKKVYVNGLGTDNLIAYEQQEPDLSITERNELDFCNDRVLGHTSSFNQYGWNNIVNRCNILSASGSVIVENMYYFHKNHLGSVIGITDKSGNTVSEYDYDVFGKVTLTSGDDTGNTRLYTGREYDKEIGLYFLRARYYNPVTGRFISKDPIGQIDDVNLYAYVGNNSVMYVDLMGLASKKISNTINYLLLTDTLGYLADGLDYISNNPNKVQYNFGLTLVAGGATVASLAATTCAPSVKVTLLCTTMATVTGPGVGICVPAAFTAGASCGTMATGVGVAALGGAMMSSSNGGVDGTPKSAKKDVLRPKKGTPNDIKRIDGPSSNVPGSQWHAHDKKGGAGYNLDGTIKDGFRGKPVFKNKTIEWLNNHGWNIK